MSDSTRCLTARPWFAQPAVISDQAAIAHPCDHSGELRRWKMLDASELLRRHVHVEGEERHGPEGR